METQTELPEKHTSVQVSGCRECLSLLSLLEDSGNDACLWCEQAEDLKENVEGLGSIRECEGKIDQWSCTLPSRRETHCMEAQQESE